MEGEMKPLRGILKKSKQEDHGESSKKRGGESSKKKYSEGIRNHNDIALDNKLRRAAKKGVLTRVGTPTTSKKDPEGLNMLASRKVSYKCSEKKFIPELFCEAKKNFRQVLPQLINKKHRKTIMEILTLWQVEELSEETQKNLLDLSICLAKNDEARVETLRSKIASDNSLALYWGMMNELIIDQIDFMPEYCKRQTAKNESNPSSKH